VAKIAMTKPIRNDALRPEDDERQFRRASRIEPKLIELKNWLTSNVPTEAREQTRRWRLCTVRLLTFAIHDSRLRPFTQACLRHLSRTHDRQVGR
jgi:hypothetical protein